MIEPLEIFFTYLHPIFINNFLNLSVFLVLNNFALLFVFRPMLISMLNGAIFCFFTIATNEYCIFVAYLAILTLGHA